MKYINGLYISLILMVFVNLLNTTIFDNEYSGITMYISSVIFVIGSAFFINAKRLKISEKK
ncbi:Uncharacterized protein BC141101_01533 [Bacillus toyonensis]|uniref:Uncharacterized protein n=1 Tax=Bacillus toyonensis TaxID=155322 RepID=A0A2C3V9F0_9BACI|nr:MULTISPECIES: hypothetical protein [Bacillus]OTX30542.1 hypothetical protein BK717_26355 [Bacillus thuringiensis serovar malayensis]OUB02964.1 hypothetical protein BK709_23275 [Bacillus thuringiensis serovar shandongiensis]PFH75053.1 hypothetical protein COI61_20110 [Bacillus cereus]EJV93571.1 hypothetical protein IGI_03289 [Bacillus toyonensis]KMN42950.1 hypothetical protein VK90_21610 [Bacillus sp. LK2]